MALLSGAGAVMIALLMVGNAAASSVNTVTVHPAYKGVVAPENSISSSGCGSSAKLVKKSNFNMKTGLGRVDYKGIAGNCGSKLPKGFSFYSSAYGDNGFNAVIKLPTITNTASNISANLGGKITSTFAATTGAKTNACPGGTESVFYNDYFYEWRSGGFYYDAENDSEQVNGVWNNFTYNLASLPSPFNLNSSTYWDHEEGNYTESVNFCESFLDGEQEVYTDLCDVTINYCTFMSGSTGAYLNFLDYELISYIDYDTSSYVDDYWDFGSGSNNTYPAASYNQSGAYWTIEQCAYAGTCAVTTGSNATATSLSNTTVFNLAGDSLWTDLSNIPSYTVGDHLYLEVEVFSYADASNDNWAHGTTSFNVNGATLGNGVKLGSITAT